MITKEKSIVTFEINHHDGLIILIEETKIIEDGEVLTSQRTHRHIEPGQDVSDEDPQVRAVCEAVHTPEVVAAYKARTPSGDE